MKLLKLTFHQMKQTASRVPKETPRQSNTLLRIRRSRTFLSTLMPVKIKQRVTILVLGIIYNLLLERLNYGYYFLVYYYFSYYRQLQVTLDDT
jgi:hypothetical protein